MVYLLRDARGAVEVAQNRHAMGPSFRAGWLDLTAAADLEPLAVPFEHSSCSGIGREVFLGLRATGADGT
jgi:hypothetical protein